MLAHGLRSRLQVRPAAGRAPCTAAAGAHEFFLPIGSLPVGYPPCWLWSQGSSQGLESAPETAGGPEGPEGRVPGGCWVRGLKGGAFRSVAGRC